MFTSMRNSGIRKEVNGTWETTPEADFQPPHAQVNTWRYTCTHMHTHTYQNLVSVFLYAVLIVSVLNYSGLVTYSKSF